eukprot:CAMPEP_0172024386 /NCGR_PEP_ID=MMETSP1041-20130122/15312_1 /TAXON_ID=464988 /ORGANISM="Hemiselmis andersenii, Strain CCMP439" /LENGTH=70 /DNA_ID=CAMNT_0012679963 /DNA_START=172 /DNA_END=381 /DNA_ORIENTATION=-
MDDQCPHSARPWMINAATRPVGRPETPSPVEVAQGALKHLVQWGMHAQNVADMSRLLYAATQPVYRCSKL